MTAELRPAGARPRDSRPLAPVDWLSLGRPCWRRGPWHRWPLLATAGGDQRWAI